LPDAYPRSTIRGATRADSKPAGNMPNRAAMYTEIRKPQGEAQAAVPAQPRQ
jgi:hypothetical protein